MSPKAIWEPGDRATLIYMIVSTVLMYSIIISIPWVGYRHGWNPLWLAIAVTAFLSSLAAWLFGSMWLEVRRTIRQRANEETTR